jgi:hypothetical protein
MMLYGTMYLLMLNENSTILTADEVKNRLQGFGFRPLPAVSHPVSGTALIRI